MSKLFAKTQAEYDLWLAEEEEKERLASFAREKEWSKLFAEDELRRYAEQDAAVEARIDPLVVRRREEIRLAKLRLHERATKERNLAAKRSLDEFSGKSYAERERIHREKYNEQQRLYALEKKVVFWRRICLV